MVQPKLLTETDIPNDLKECYNLNSQHQENERTVIDRHCKKCGKVDTINVKPIFALLKNGKCPFGLCRACQSSHDGPSGPKVGMGRSLKDNGDKDKIHFTMETDPAFCSWFTGFFDGEGSIQMLFSRSKNDASYWKISVAIQLRRDDESVLQTIKEKIGGNVTYVTTTFADGSVHYHRQAAWHFTSIIGCCGLADLFEQFPLRTKKNYEAKLWSEAVRHLASTRNRLEQDDARLTEIAALIVANRVFEKEQ